MAKNTFRYTKSDSIIVADTREEIGLTDPEIAILYRTFVLETPLAAQSDKSISFAERGWAGGFIKSGLKERLANILDLDDPYLFFFSTGQSLKREAQNYRLSGGMLQDIDEERGIFCETSGEYNYHKLFHHLRNCLAHGNFKLVISGNNPVFLFEDRDRDKNSPNVTARFILKKSTVLAWANIITERQANHE